MIGNNVYKLIYFTVLFNFFLQVACVYDLYDTQYVW
jgi:hypothetical protein